jgi:hypothetical protein
MVNSHPFALLRRNQWAGNKVTEKEREREREIEREKERATSSMCRKAVISSVKTDIFIGDLERKRDICVKIHISDKKVLGPN